MLYLPVLFHHASSVYIAGPSVNALQHSPHQNDLSLKSVLLFIPQAFADTWYHGILGTVAAQELSRGGPTENRKERSP